MDDKLTEQYWRTFDDDELSCTGLENRIPLRPMQNQRDRTNLRAATTPYHTDEDGRKRTTTSTMATKDSSSGSLLHNTPRRYGTGRIGVDPSVRYEDNEGHTRAGTGADGNVMFEGSEGMYANNYQPLQQGLTYTMTQSDETTANQPQVVFGSTANIDFPFNFELGRFFTPSEIQYAANMQSFNGEGLSARLSSSQELATYLTPAEDQQSALPTPTSIPRGLEPYLDLPASHATGFCGDGDFDGSTSQQNYPTPAHSPGSSSASIGLDVSDPYGSQLPTPSPSAHSHASLRSDSPSFPTVRPEYTGVSYPGTAVQLAAVPFVSDPYPYPQSVAYGPSQAGPSILYLPTPQQTPPSAQGVVSRKRGTETRDTASLPAPAAKKGGNGKGPGRIPKAKNFKCTVAGCDASYESKGTRNRHVKSHDRSKRLLCPNAQCTKPGEGGPSSFLDLHGLIRHVYNSNCDCRSKAPGLPAERTQENMEAVNSILLKLSEERKRELQLQAA